jgi:hypothetical protein
MISNSFTLMDTGKLYRDSLELLLLELGKNVDISIIDFDAFSILATDSLVKSSWEFLYHNKVSLSHDITLPSSRVHDRPIMVAIYVTSFFIRELLAINKCRIFLKKAYFI